MKRFFCVVCAKVKRVQELPANIVDRRDAFKVTDRVGTCERHTEDQVKAALRVRRG